MKSVTGVEVRKSTPELESKAGRSIKMKDRGTHSIARGRVADGKL
ncbi:hypothetical protein EVAR_37529_1, partial [Eumeta japonica]